MAGNTLRERLGIEHPLIQAPMAGGTTPPKLVAAVSQAGGLGSTGAAYLSAQQILNTAREIRSLTSKPFNMNLFTGGYSDRPPENPAPMMALLAEIHRELGLEPPILPQLPPDPLPAQLEAVLEARPPVFSFTFGIPPREMLARMRAAGIVVAGTATTVAEARALAEIPVDVIVAQGAEAGGHRGTFAHSFEEGMVPTRELLRATLAAVSLPVVTAGGLMDGHDIAFAMRLGAAGAQMGTAFIPCPESGAPEAYKKALLAASSDTTVVTRAFSGRPARGLLNDWISRFHGREQEILPYPLQNVMTRPMRVAAGKRGLTGYISMWAGQGVARSRALGAGDLVRRLAQEMEREADKAASA